MLLRWLINNYLRDAAEGKVRGVVADVLNRAELPKASAPTLSASTLNPEPRTPNPAPNTQSPSDPIPCDVAFLFALGIESGGLVDQLQESDTSRHPHGTEHAGKLAGREVVIVESGVGAKAAARATAEAIKFYQPQWVISAGFSGGLTESLRRGHIVIADEVVDLAGRKLPASLTLDPQTVAATRGLHVGRILTVSEIIREPEERHQLAKDHGAIACDMESFAVAETCLNLDVRFMAIRIISDAVDDELPPEIERLLAQKTLAGKLGAAAGAVMHRLSAATDLWRLREDALKASDRLAKFLAGVVGQLPMTNDK